MASRGSSAAGGDLTITAKTPVERREAVPDPLAGRLGLAVPHEWWPSAPLLKSYEAAGFSWVQLHAPPLSVLADPRSCHRHATHVARSLATTALRSIIHAPGSLRAGGRAANRAFEGALSYVAEVGAELLVYHGLDLPDDPSSAGAQQAEARALETLAELADRLEVTIAIENLAPVYPGPERISAIPMNLRGLVRRIGSRRLRICLDVGHAHIVADRRRTGVERLVDPVLDVTGAFHLHDNLGARRGGVREALGVDPLRLDLHLPPGRGTVPWSRLAERLTRHRAPVVLEAHPPYRPRAAELVRITRRALRVAPAAERRLYPRV